MLDVRIETPTTLGKSRGGSFDLATYTGEFSPDIVRAVALNELAVSAQQYTGLIQRNLIVIGDELISWEGVSENKIDFHIIGHWDVITKPTGANEILTIVESFYPESVLVETRRGQRSIMITGESVEFTAEKFQDPHNAFSLWGEDGNGAMLGLKINDLSVLLFNGGGKYRDFLFVVDKQSKTSLIIATFKALRLHGRVIPLAIGDIACDSSVLDETVLALRKVEIEDNTHWEVCEIGLRGEAIFKYLIVWSTGTKSWVQGWGQEFRPFSMHEELGLAMRLKKEIYLD